MQTKLLAIIAVVMIVVIAFSGRKPVPERKSSTTPVPPPVIDPSPPRIQEYRATLDEATHRLAAEEAELTRAKQTVAQESNLPAGSANGIRAGTGNSYPALTPEYRYEPQLSPLQAEREKREYQSLFASNIVFSYRPPSLTVPPSLSVVSPVVSPRSSASEPPAAPSLLAKDGRNAAGEYRLLEGTILETVLTNRLDSSFSGPVNCMITTNIYSPDHSVVLVPQGSRVLGEVRKVESLGDQRLAVVYHRLIRPDGYSISLDRFVGLDQIGETGLRDQINHHYAQIFGASIAIGAIAGLAQSNTRYGGNESASDVYQQGVSASLSQSAIHILDRYLNVLPTFTVREGQRIKIYLSQDLTIPAYEPTKGQDQ